MANSRINFVFYVDVVATLLARRRSECAYVVKLLLLQLRVIFLLSCAEIARALSLSQSLLEFDCALTIPENLFVMHKHTLSYFPLSLSLSLSVCRAQQQRRSSSSNFGLLVCFVFELLPVLLLRSKPTAVRSYRRSLCVCVSVCVRVRVQ